MGSINDLENRFSMKSSMPRRGLLMRATLLEPFPDTFGVVSRTVDMLITSHVSSCQEKTSPDIQTLVPGAAAAMEGTAD
jgi:hypothetical protein